MKLNSKRLLDTFVQLVQIDSESFTEKKIQEFVSKELKKIGCRVMVDKAGSKFDTNARGNVLGFLPGTVASQPFVLVAHLDTVRPGRGVKPQVKKDCVTSDGTTILGADDKAGVAIILEVLRVLQEQKIPHPPVEVLFTLCEERGMYGSKNLDYRKLKGREGLILDNEEVGELLIQGPRVNDIKVEVIGLAAHAGVCPEKGISALEVAAYALSHIKLGRIDKETVANFGVVQGGQVTNIVMDRCTLLGEARSLSDRKLDIQTAQMKRAFEQAVKHFTRRIDGRVCKPKINFSVSTRYAAVCVSKSHPIVSSVLAAAKRLHLPLRLASSGGGCDANVLSGLGFTLPNLGVGVRDCHTVKEKLILKEFYAAFELVLSTVTAYRKK
ncbi:MAG: M20/M25/M40 family metallo-hydrolase [Elusimicrobiaceae bacterium]|nr:M20/M25/M40 family metallo-hydrolase [Elusimicrobiaceae bacterium]